MGTRDRMPREVSLSFKTMITRASVLILASCAFANAATTCRDVKLFYKDHDCCEASNRDKSVSANAFSANTCRDVKKEYRAHSCCGGDPDKCISAQNLHGGTWKTFQQGAWYNASDPCGEYFANVESNSYYTGKATLEG